MSISASSLIALVEARGAKEAAGQLLEVGAASDTAGTRIKNLATGGLLVAGAALVGIGVASTKMAGQFESSTNLLITSANEVPANIDLIRKGLLQMSVDTATPVDELTKGMFNIESAGYHGAAALKVEAAAAEGAKVENADLTATTGILVTAMHDFHEPASQATDVMNSFRMAASMGVMHLADLNAALKNVLPVASAAGVSLTDVEAALSTMSLAGDKGSIAGTHLAQMLTYLLAPSSKATKALTEVGLTTQQISDEMKVSLPGTVEMITQAVGEKFPIGSAKYIAALSAIVGGNKSMRAILELSGISLKTFTADAEQLAPTMKANATAVDGWNTVQSNFNFKMQAAKDAVDELLITLGTKLLPVVGQVVKDVTPLITGFSDWMNKSNGLSGAIDEVSSAFQQVFEPVKQVQDVTKPLLDTFDRATSIFMKTNTEAKPLMDTFDRGKSILSTTNAVAMPLFDTFDRATALLPKTTDVIKKTTEAVSPLVAIFKYWKPVLEDVFKDVQILAGDVGTFATGVVDAAEKSGFFQSALQFLHDELPVVGAFLVNAGDAINQNLLPPLESLITNVGSAAAGFLDWADKSGVAQTYLNILGFEIQTVTQILGPLVQAVSDVVGWLGGGGAGTDTLVFALSAAATAFTLLKIADTTAQFGSFISKLQEGDGIISNLANSVKDKLAKAFDDFLANQAPNLKASMDGIKVSAEEAAVAEETVAAAPADESAAGWLTRLETSLEGVGTAAETSATEVAVASTEMDASLAGVGTAAEGAEGGIAAVGTASTAAGAGVTGFGLAAAAAAAPLVVLGAIAVGTFALIENGALNFDKTVTTSTGQTVQAQQIRYRQLAAGASATGQQISTSADTMKNNVSNSAQTMNKNVQGSFDQMNTKSVASVQTLSVKAMQILDGLKSSALGDFSTIDQQGISYWNDVADYINTHPINASINIDENPINSQGKAFSPTQLKDYRKNAYASGTDYAPGGDALVAEAGAELILGPRSGYLPRGSRVIPNDQLMHAGSGWGGGGGKITVEIPLIINGKEFAHATIDDIMHEAASGTRLRYGRRVF